MHIAGYRGYLHQAVSLLHVAPRPKHLLDDPLRAERVADGVEFRPDKRNAVIRRQTDFVAHRAAGRLKRSTAVRGVALCRLLGQRGDKLRAVSRHGVFDAGRLAQKIHQPRFVAAKRLQLGQGHRRRSRSGFALGQGGRQRRATTLAVQKRRQHPGCRLAKRQQRRTATRRRAHVNTAQAVKRGQFQFLRCSAGIDQLG